MEFGRGMVLLITQEGKLFDQARIDRVEETGNGRILHVASTITTDYRRYNINELCDEETWEVFCVDPYMEAAPSMRHHMRRVLLEVVR